MSTQKPQPNPTPRPDTLDLESEVVKDLEPAPSASQAIRGGGRSGVSG